MEGDSSATEGHFSGRGGGLSGLGALLISDRTAASFAATVAGVGLFALLHLAPKIVRVEELTTDYRSEHVRLLKLERQVQRLERVAEALRHDPGFAEQIARIELSAGRQGEEVIAVDPSLRLQPNQERAPIPEASREPSLTAVAATPFARSTPLRITVAFVAAALLAYGLLIGSSDRGRAASRAVGEVLRWTERGIARYRRSGPHG